MLIYAICFSLLFPIHVSSSCLEFILSILGWAGLAASYMLILSTLCVSPSFSEQWLNEEWITHEVGRGGARYELNNDTIYLSTLVNLWLWVEKSMEIMVPYAILFVAQHLVDGCLGQATMSLNFSFPI